MKHSASLRHSSPAIFKTFVLAAVTLGIASAASAADIKQVGGGSTSIPWSTASLWEGGNAPSAGNDYFTDGYIIYTANNANGTSTFAGDSLTVQNNLLGLKAKTVNISKLTLQDASIRNATDSGGTPPQRSSTMNIGTLTLTGVNVMNAVNSTSPITLNVQTLNGAGSLRVGVAYSSGQAFGLNNTYNFNIASASGFAGNIELVNGKMVLTGSLSMGSGELLMANSGATLDLGAFDITVSGFKFGSTALNAGTYSASDLNAAFGTSAFSGSGNLTIAIPEASTSALLAGFAVLGIVLSARRFRGKRASRVS